MNNQEFFNVVWNRAKDHRRAMPKEHGLMQMNKPTSCRYRLALPSGETLKCFVGECIPDDVYQEEMDNGLVTAYNLQSKFTKTKENLGDVNVDLMGECQRIHDFAEFKNWDRELRVVALTYNLNVPE